jgi:hypothetical protein
MTSGMAIAVLEGEPFAGATDAGLHLVEHQPPFVVVTDAPQPGQVIGLWNLHAALALIGLDQHGNDILVMRRQLCNGLGVAERDAHEAADQRLEAGLHLAISGGGEGRHGAPVETLFHDHDGRIVYAPVMAMQARQLDRCLVGLGTGIAEEGAVHAGQCAEPVGQGFLQGNPVQVRGMDQSPGLLAQGARQLRVGMAQTVDGDAGDGIEVLVALFVVEPDALAARKGNGLTGVGLHEVFGHRDFPAARKTIRR